MATSTATKPQNLKVTAIAQFTDNYAWLIHDDTFAWIIDPGQAAPILARLQSLGLELKGIFITHCHWDHVAGIADLQNSQPVPVFGTLGSHPEITHGVSEGTVQLLSGNTLEVWQTPGHMADHLSFYLPNKQWFFCGDTLFFAGCGRLKQTGNMAELFTSTQRIAQLPRDTQVFCSHEYTLNNLAFAASIEPNNLDINIQINRVKNLRAAGTPSIPSSIDIELRCNPFLRLSQASLLNNVNIEDKNDQFQVFKALRELKDSF